MAYGPAHGSAYGDEAHGEVEEGFGAVADAFARNFAEGGELGGAVAVFHRGRKVVDLWGGVADEGDGRAWTAGTVAPVFSCSKGLLSLCVQLLTQRGELDLDAPVARYWPAFAQGGKEAVTVRTVLAHRAGLPVVDGELGFRDVLDWTPVTDALAAQRPLWEPGSAHEYHAQTFGWLVGEVIRRVTGRTPGAYLRSALADELGLYVWIGLPERELPRLARVAEPAGAPADGSAGARLPDADSLSVRALTLGGALAFPGLDDPRGWNSPALLTGEIPASGAVASAKGLAALYAAAATGVRGSGSGSAEPGQRAACARLLSPDTVTDAVREQSAGPWWSGADLGLRWGTGFQIDSAPVRAMLGPRSFGHDGAGGETAFGDDEYGVGFGYVTSRMGGPYGDERANDLVAALRRCLEG